MKYQVLNMLTAIHVTRPFLPYEKMQKLTRVAYRACAPVKLASVKVCLLTVFVMGRSVLPSAIRRETCLFSYVVAMEVFWARSGRCLQTTKMMRGHFRCDETLAGDAPLRERRSKAALD